ncbi:hypothetical protein PMAYCL1PPCAC_25127, partial [Pristionchus mayeri]
HILYRSTSHNHRSTVSYSIRAPAPPLVVRTQVMPSPLQQFSSDTSNRLRRCREDQGDRAFRVVHQLLPFRPCQQVRRVQAVHRVPPRPLQLVQRGQLDPRDRACLVVRGVPAGTLCRCDRADPSIRADPEFLVLQHLRVVRAGPAGPCPRRSPLPWVRACLGVRRVRDNRVGRRVRAGQLGTQCNLGAPCRFQGQPPVHRLRWVRAHPVLHWHRAYRRIHGRPGDPEGRSTGGCCNCTGWAAPAVSSFGRGMRWRGRALVSTPSLQAQTAPSVGPPPTHRPLLSERIW